MKKITFIIELLSLLLISSPSFAQSQLMPMPKEVRQGKGKFILSKARIFISNDLSQDEHNSLSQFVSYVKDRTGIGLLDSYSKDISSPLIILNSDHEGSDLPKPDDKIGKESREAYQLTVSPDKIVIHTKSDAGIFYGLETLRQLIIAEGEKSFVPSIYINDYPSLAYRGIMFDCSHGALPTVSEIKRQINFIAKWKMNQYILYSEVSIQLKGFPIINYNKCYTQKQIKDIIDFAKTRHVQVVPEIELYGHLHDLFKIEKYSDLSIVPYGHEFDPRNPKVDSFVRDCIKQYVALFPSPFFHIGFDETWETVQLSKTDTSIKPKQLYLDQLDFVTKDLARYGKRVMVWTDITRDYPSIMEKFPKSLLPEIWEYSHDSTVMDNWIKPILREKFPFFILSAVDGWQHIYPDASYTYDNIDLCLRSCKEYGATGYHTSVWSDAVQTLLRNSWIFLAYGGIGSWQGEPPQNRDKFVMDYCKLMYPKVAGQMDRAFKEMEASQMYLEKCFHGRHTLPEMWQDPFSSFSLKNTKEFSTDYKNARIAAENAEGALIEALQQKTKDSAFIKTLIVNSRLLDYTGMRFLWARRIVDYWDNYVDGKGIKEAWIMFYDIEHSEHGLISNLLDFDTELRSEYKQAWLSQNMPYRLNNMVGRFNVEFNFWYDLRQKIKFYKDNFDIDKNPVTFENEFKSLVYPLK